MKHDFTPYLNPVFIETGSYVGTGIVAAIKADFETVISIELADFYYDLCYSRFNGLKGVKLYHGDSALVLPEILKDINQRCTFWLDGHFCGDVTASGITPVPLMEELKAIANHPIKNHTILIDDMRLLRTHDAEWKDLKYTVKDVIRFLKAINKNYKITFDRGVTKDDILIAQI